MKTGRHAVGAVTEPMTTVRPATAPAAKPTAWPIEPSLDTEAMPAITPEVADDWGDWKRTHAEKDPDVWLAPLLTGGGKVEQRLKATFRERGLMLPNRVSRAIRRFRTALAKGGKK